MDISHSTEFRRCIIDIDIPAARKLWRHVAPHFPQPKTDHEALTTIHMARTQMDAMPMQMRAYSHRWLLDSGYPSQLPDELKPQAERMYPRIIEAVGLSINSSSPHLKPVADMVRIAMENTINDAYSNRVRPSLDQIKDMMAQARVKIIKKLLG